MDCKQSYASIDVFRPEKSGGPEARMAALRVLHIDDELDVRELVEMSLALDPDVTLRACETGLEAIQAAHEWSPDVILLDALMPEMDGQETLRRLRQDPRTSAIPIIFLTAHTSPREVVHLFVLGAEGVIPKPFNPVTLAASVRNHMRQTRLSDLDRLGRAV
jgi:CheY-like chemotaxis protein